MQIFNEKIFNKWPTFFQGSREEWSHVFLMFGGLFSAAALIFVLTGSAARQKWADPQPKKDAADVKLPR
jgi:hypothetical protein